MGDLRVRTLLIIAYELPPSAGGGVQRITKFVRYLPQHGWNVRVVSAMPIPGRPRDESLIPQVAAAHITRVPARNMAVAIARLLSPLKRKPASSGVGARPAAGATSGASRPKAPLSSRITRWIASPDETAPWMRGAVRAALASARECPVDAVFATAPPFSTLAVGARVAAHLGVPLIADMRDSWRDNSAFNWPTDWHKRRSLRLERELLASAVLVTAASAGIESEAREMGARETAVIPNGFDPADVPPWSPQHDDGLDFVFIGRLYANVSDPTTFFDALALLRERGTLPAGTHVTFIGSRTPWSVALADSRGLTDVVEFRDFMPYAQAIAAVAAADVGLIMTANGPGANAMFPGKLFDYLGVGVPVLLIGSPDGVAAGLVTEARAGVVAEYSSTEEIARAILLLAAQKADGTLGRSVDSEVVARFDRTVQVAALARLLDGVVGVPHE